MKTCAPVACPWIWLSSVKPMDSIKQTFLELTANGLFLLVIACVFLCITLLWYAVQLKGQQYMGKYKEEFTSTASANMSDMFMFVDPNKLFQYNIIAIIVLPILVLILTRDIPASLAMLAIVLVLPTMFYKSMKAKRLRRFESQLPDGLIMLSGAMRAGASLNIALESLVKEQPAPLSQEFDVFLREQRVGVDFEVSLSKMEQRIPLQDFSMLVTALRINREVVPL